MMIKILFFFLKSSLKVSQSGFTLIELLAAAMMTLFIVGAAGFGMIVMLREQTGSSIASDTQFNLSRAADFMREEIQSADFVETGIALPSGCGVGTNSTIRLRMPFTPTTGTQAGNPTSYFIYYSLRTPDSPWLGNRAIFRCAPPFEDNGEDISVVVSTGLPESPVSTVLVDLIALTRDPKDPGTCSNGGTAYPTNTNTGFFVCVLNNKQVEIHLAASALDNTSGKLQWVGSDTNSRFNDKARYGIITQAYARSKGPVNFTSSSSATFSGTVEATIGTSGTCSFPIDIGGTATNKTDTNNVTVILNSSSSGSPVTLTPNGGSALAVTSVGTTSNTATFSGGGCSATVTLNTL
jgi:type II secretory pathway pseudopilin PulG